MNPRSEPLLWVQLVGLAAAPLELLLLFLILAGSDAGPFPLLERLLCFALGGLAPAVLLWRHPADPWSLLLLKTPVKGRRELQNRLSGLAHPLPLKLAQAAGVAALLPLLWILDSRAGLAADLSPLANSSRLVDLLLAAFLLSLVVWQWHQLLQAGWMLRRPVQQLAAGNLPQAEQTGHDLLNLGLPLLLPGSLQLIAASSPVAPEQQAEQQQGSDLDEQIH
ncbi:MULTISPECIES: low-complexity tail membrane protein [unclassified Synechococcus]|uniref:low-complexity tail membrane protein n=1 Tax=unclassified Synechococcus TaxID=2626047 RepID=UPI0021A3C9D4|nr:MULTISPECIES: low-complexity tail membrane protein [unclassified Synechococcus]MCT0213414.1 low-complexity tail membrane protein [Synechococcus sp. CS-1326]MCT0232732.1 low-complexity tail membrane protein [Synechococcus sp. CS-1327]